MFCLCILTALRMLLACDIGNSNIVYGIHDGDRWLHTWRLDSHSGIDPLSREIKDNIEPVGSDITTVIVSSVVPELTEPIRNVLSDSIPANPILIGPELYSRLPVNVTNPEEIGSDLVCNSVAAFDKVKDAVIVVDFGTALTFTLVDEKGEIKGVSIAPGIRTAAAALTGKASKLPEIPLELPEKVIGTNTIQAMQAGLLWGYTGMVDFMVSRFREESGSQPKVIATGGLSMILEPLHDIFDHMDQNLTLEGMRLIFEYNQR